MSDNSRSVNEVTIMKVMIVVVGVTEVYSRVTSYVGGGRDYTTPSCLTYKWISLFIRGEDCEGGFELRKTCLSRRRG